MTIQEYDMIEDILTKFIEIHFSDELKTEIFRSLNIFDYFGYELAYIQLDGVMADMDRVSTDSTRDALFTVLDESVDELLKINGVELNDQALLTDKNNILYALIILQHREDYTPIGRMLETFDEDELIFSRIVAELMNLSETDILTILASLSPRLLPAIQTFIETKEVELSEYNELEQSIINKVRLFIKIAGADSLVGELVDSGVYIGAEFDTYLPYVADHLVTSDPTQTAKNFLGILYLSSNYTNDPLKGYREVADSYFDNLIEIQKVEVKLMELIGRVKELMGAENEANRIS